MSDQKNVFSRLGASKFWGIVLLALAFMPSCSITTGKQPLSETTSISRSQGDREWTETRQLELHVRRVSVRLGCPLRPMLYCLWNVEAKKSAARAHEPALLLRDSNTYGCLGDWRGALVSTLLAVAGILLIRKKQHTPESATPQ